jgi:lipopolysaccharide biosynthesis regulator YciM
MHKEAIQELEQTAVLVGKNEIARLIRQGFVVSGPEGAMRAWAKELERVNSTNEAFLPLSTAQAYAALGDKDHAFYWLEQAYQHTELASLDDGLMDLKVDPMLDPLRSDPRYQDLLRRVGLPP